MPSTPPWRRAGRCWCAASPAPGQSQLARAAAAGLGRAFVSTVIDARTEARDLLWSFDAVARLAEAQVQGALPGRSEKAVRKSLQPKHFLAPGPLWWAFEWGSTKAQAKSVGAALPPEPADWRPEQGAVVLIDEIDKADAAVPNGLLECLGQGAFTCPDGRQVSQAPEVRPLVVLTTNEERALPDPFLRRCLVLHLAWPEKRNDLEAALAERGRAHFPDCSEKVLKKTAEVLAGDREEVAEKGLYPPGGAEYLDLLRTLIGLAPEDEDRQLELLKRVDGFALDKHPTEPKW